jgi:hypothetical protein
MAAGAQAAVAVAVGPVQAAAEPRQLADDFFPLNERKPRAGSRRAALSVSRHESPLTEKARMAIDRLVAVAILAAALAGCSHSYSGSTTSGQSAPPSSVTTNEGAPAGPGAPPSNHPSHVRGSNTPGESGVSGSSSSTSGSSGGSAGAQ